MNIDAGTMAPTEHGKLRICSLYPHTPGAARASLTVLYYLGEVYVLNDGGEVDLDLGNYERYLDVTLSKDNNITTGKIYREVIEREVSHSHIPIDKTLNVLTHSQRKGDYLGKTVQIVPHVTNAIQDWIERVSKIPSDSTGEEPDVCIIEVRSFATCCIDRT